MKLAKNGYSDCENHYVTPGRYPKGSLKESTSGRLQFEQQLGDYLLRKKDSFHVLLFRYIDSKKMSDAQVYQKACIDRRLFSKIRGNTSYHPSKNTAISLAIALSLDITEVCELLQSAGYALSDSMEEDLIVRFYIERGVFCIRSINETLDAYHLPLL